ncbi:MAG: type IV secretion system DNA-binding domain-containing protein [Candidatus Pacebacteria bacterium]|nr:type IV secretion system DNA-binding domain-containing protein [Candidatus Paceibacterota bacterium]
MNFDFSTINPLVIIIPLVLLGLFFLVLLIFRSILKKKQIVEHRVFLIKLPKDKPQDANKDETIQTMQEDIAKGETLLAAIGGLRAQRGQNHWLKGRTDHFGLEIVAHNNKIAFYLAVPEDKTRYIEQQIHAYYPEAVIEEILDYNAFNIQNQVLAGTLKTRKSFALPIKTYKDMEVDPMSSIINVLSKLDKDESITVQYLVRSAKASWHSTIKNIVRNSHKKNSLQLSSSGSGGASKIFSFLFDMFSSASKSKSASEQTMDTKRLTANEEEVLKKMEEKNAKAGLDINLRMIVSAKTQTKSIMYLENLANAFSEYNAYEKGNNFGSIDKSKQKQIVHDFIFRRFDDKKSFLLNTEELVGLFHFPTRTMETPNILWLTARVAPAPSDIPEEGLLLGRNSYRGITKDIYIKRPDRRRHTYIIGKSGTGKSVHITNMAVQDIENGEGVCVLDPHGDLIEDIIQRVPPQRAEDVIVFSPGDVERPMALNLLEYDEKYPEQKSFVINEMIGIFDKLYDLKATGGPMFEQYMRNALLLIMDSPELGSTLMEVPKVLADEDFRKLKISKCKNQTVVDFWSKEAEKAGGEAALANIVPYITSKLTPFISNDMMRPIIGQQKSSFNFRELMDSQKILLIDLPKGVIGETNAYLLGMIIVGKILMASLSRANMAQEDRKDFYLYIDEFQNFTTDSICAILSEARKYALNLIIAHQYIGQLSQDNNSEIKDAVFGNVGTMITFKVGSEDAEYLVKDFGPTFNEFDLINIGKGTACIKLLVDNTSTKPFSLQTIWPMLGTAREDMSVKIRNLSRLKYGQDKRIVEAEIKKRGLAT